MVDQDTAAEPARECLREGQGTCRGEVTGRPSHAGTGTIIFECGLHQEQSQRHADDINRRYPRHAPADFDPMYAGERWDEGDY
jgi:hypothetical protein